MCTGCHTFAQSRWKSFHGQPGLSDSKAKPDPTRKFRQCLQSQSAGTSGVSMTWATLAFHRQNMHSFSPGEGLQSKVGLSCWWAVGHHKHSFSVQSLSHHKPSLSLLRADQECSLQDQGPQTMHLWNHHPNKWRAPGYQSWSVNLFHTYYASGNSHAVPCLFLENLMKEILRTHFTEWVREM